jgi:hypothetical protein
MIDRSASARTTSGSRATWFKDQTFCKKSSLDGQFIDLLIQLGASSIETVSDGPPLALASSEPTPSMTVFFSHGSGPRGRHRGSTTPPSCLFVNRCQCHFRPQLNPVLVNEHSLSANASENELDLPAWLAPAIEEAQAVMLYPHGIERGHIVC